MNIVFLTGRLTRDPEIRMTNGAEPKKVANFSLAVNQFNREGVDYINCTVFEKSAEIAEDNWKKGTKLMVRGHWHTGKYTNKEGRTVYTNDCIVDSWEYMESKQAEQVEEPKFMEVPKDIDEELPF